MGVVKLGDVARESRLKWTKSKQDVPIVGLEHLIPDEIRFDAYDINTDNTFSKRFVKGQVLFGRRRAYQRKAAIAEFDGICSGDITVIQAIEGKMLPELLPFIIQTPVFFDYANRGSAGSLSPRVKWEHLADYEFELPPLEEQKILADKLWAAYRLKEAYKKLLVATDEMVKSQFIEMFGTVESYCKLEDLVSDTFPGEWGSEPTSENAIKVIRTTNFTNEGHLDLADVVTRDIEPKKVARKKLKQGDTILERSGGTKDNPVGRVVFFDEIGDYLLNNFTQALRPKESVNPVYLFYALYNSYNINKAAMRAMASQTTGIQNLSMSDFMSKSIVLPSRDEQNKFEQIYRQADKSKFGDFKSQFIEMVGDPRNNPKGWPTKRLSELAEYSIGLTYKPEQICDDGTIVLRSGNIQDGKISFSDIVRVNAPIKESLFVKEDDILMCSRNGSASLVGKVAMIPDINEPMTFGAFMTIIRSAEAKYLYLYFQSQDFRERVSEGKSSTMNQITQKMLDKVEVPFPDKDVRETLSAIASQADKSKFELKQCIEHIDKVIKSLING